ncbi:VCBS repeat-containing protein [Pseudochelatococcus lubricantis]|uniref:VCBS repeat-containing protein n=1 Tax=Pseudochelatococcus lubricantis TaxID=1538102 RepID=A0ABX0UXA1_9HYPH|nr:Ig-like domain-containing protein [Pseudochelatococcus lubricantis]NIJ57566.1 VCBS repeat-containing protein [Pseudochelatococcus lubricantis]
MSDDAVLFAHRGTNPYLDNSIDAYRWGFNYGADYAETDFRLTKDGVLVSYHDDLALGIANMTYAEVRAQVPTIVTLDELIALTKEMSIDTGRKLGILIETKSTDYATHEAAIKTLIAHDFADPERIIIQSFGSELPDVRNKLMPQYGVNLPLVQLTGGSLTPENIAYYATYADGVAPVMSLLTPQLVAAAHAAGLVVNGWTVDGTLADVQNALNLGVDGIIADNTQWSRPALEKLVNDATVVYGTERWDVVNGTAGADRLYAMQGDDILRAGDGDDVLYGDGGNDLLFGGAGNDRLVGGSGDDFLSGGEGKDVLDGGAGNDVIVATGDEVIFRAGDGIDLVSLDSTSTIRFEGIVPADISVIRDGNNLIIRSGSDALILRDGVDPAHQPASITTADGLKLTGAELAALAVPGTDAEVAALLPDLEAKLASAPALAAPSTIPIGTDLVADGDFGNGVLAQKIADAETGAIYRLSFSLTDLPTGDDGVRVLWGGKVIYEGIPSGTGSKLHFIVNGGAGNGSNELVFEGAGESFGATLDNVHLVKLSDPMLPSPSNVVPEAPGADLLISPGIPFIGKVAATDANGDELTYSLSEAPAHGTLVFKENGAYRYTPAPGFSGADSFTFLVNDGRGGIVESTVNLTVAQSVLLGTDLIVNGSFEDVSINGSFEEVSGELSPAWWGYYNDNGVVAGWADINGNRVEIVNAPENQNNVKPKDGAFFFDLDGYGKLSEIGQTVVGVEQGAIYELKFSIADGDARTDDDGVQVLWGGKVIFEGMPSSNAWATVALELVGGAGDGSNTLIFKGTGAANWFGAALDEVSLRKIANVGEPAPDNRAPDAVDGNAEGPQNGVISGRLTASDPDGDTSLVFSLREGPAHGTVRVYTDGTYKYTPAAGFTGEDSFTFVVNDAHGGTDTATLSLTVSPADVPVGTDLIVNGSFEDVSESSDSNGPSDWGYRNLDGAIVGWTDLNNGIEQHWDNYGGVTAKDGRFWIDMDSSNLAARHRIGQTITSVETGATYRVTFSLSDSDNVRDDDGLRVLWNGEEIFNGLPPQTSASWTTYSFDVVGGSGDGSNRLEFIDTGAPDSWGAGVALDDVHFVKTANVGEPAPDNRTPDAVDGNAEGLRNAVISGRLTASDPDGDTSLVFSLREGPAHGTVRVYTDGTYKYTPTAGFIGKDSFTFLVNDGHGGTDTATLSLTVSSPTPVNVPIGTDLIVNGSFEDVSESSDNNGPSDWGYRNLDGTILGWTNVNNNRIEQHWDNYGGVTAKDGRFWIDMDSSNLAARHRIGQSIANVETGATYQVTFSLSDSDNVRDDDGVRVLWNGEEIFNGVPPQTSASWTTYSFDVIGGSGDGSNRLEFIDTGAPDSWGAGAALDDVHFVKTANAHSSVAIGTDLIVNGSFEDVSESSGNNGPSDWGYRNLDGTILGWTNVNNNRIEQHWDNYGGVTAKDGRFWIDMDSSNLAARHRIGQSIANVETDATYRVTFSLSDSDNVRDDDGVRVLWNGVEIFNGLPPQTSASWTTYSFDVVGGSGDGSNRLEFIDTGAPDSWGAGVALDDVHFVKIANVGDSLPDNRAPDAVDVNAEGLRNAVISGRLTASDPDGDASLIFSLREEPSHGAVLVYTDGTYKYTPATGFTGEDSFTFLVNDGRGGSTEAKVRLTVSAPNSAPVASDDGHLDTEYGTALTIKASVLLANDTDADGDTLTIRSVTAGAGGTVALDDDGNVVFTPAEGFSGGATFTYTVTDGKGGTANATVTVQVAELDTVPTAGYSGDVWLLEGDAVTSKTGQFEFDGGANNGVVTDLGWGPEGGAYDVGNGTTVVPLTSNGLPVSVSHEDKGPLTLIGRASDGNEVFRVSATETGAYTVSLSGTLDHPDAGLSGADDALRLRISFTVTDTDGDMASGYIQFDIRDQEEGVLYDISANQFGGKDIYLHDADALVPVLGTDAIDRVFYDGEKATVVLPDNIEQGTLLDAAKDSRLFGGAGDNTLTGNAFDNVIRGGAGRDVMTGGKGADTFLFDAADQSGARQIDLVTDFNIGEGDKLAFDGLGVHQQASGRGTSQAFTNGVLTNTISNMLSSLTNDVALATTYVASVMGQNSVAAFRFDDNWYVVQTGDRTGNINGLSNALTMLNPTGLRTVSNMAEGNLSIENVVELDLVGTTAIRDLGQIVGYDLVA